MKKSKENKKQKIIRKGKESTVIEFNLSKAVILLIIIGAIIAGIVTKEIVTTIIETNQRELLANDETDLQSTRSINGDLGYINSVDLKEVKTGTGPFDENDEPGNDSSEDNDIVRSFDQITWTYQLNFALKNPEEEASLTGGVIKITADLPEELAEIVEWDIESMKWLSNSTISENGIQLTGEYSMNEEQITIPGNQDVIFVLKVKNAVNGTKIKPTFTFILEGNEQSEKKEIEAEKEITVSATGRYNIQLHRNTSLADKTTVDYGEGEVTGRMYGYGFAVQLYNNTYSEEENPYAKGIKGIEYPQGEISFDIDLKLERTKINSEIIEDVTNEITPIIWNYRANNSTTTDLSGNIEERDMYYKDNDRTIYDSLLPKGIDTGDRSMSVYNSGDIKIEQEGATLHVTINNYEFDETYPQYIVSYEDNPNRGKIYQDNVGTFSIGFIQIFVPEPVETIQDVNSYYLSLEINNFKANSSKEEITKQEVTTDDSSRVQYIISQSGNKDAFIDMGAFSNRGRDGDVAVFRSQVINVSLTTSQSSNPDPEYYLYSQDYIYKFDGEGLEPAYDEITFSTNNGLQCKAYYLTKLDGTNWTNQDEMNKTIELEDFNIYKNKQDIPENYIIVGILFESLEGSIQKPVYSGIDVRMKIKETANIGQTYGMTMAVRGWVQENQLDRSIYTADKLKSYKDYPEPYWIKAGQEYVKTEYDENGQIVTGTHKNSYSAGNTVLVLGGNLSGNINAISNNAEKINYDLGKNEDIVTYNLEPILEVDENLSAPIEDITLKAQVILPKGLSYQLGSSKRGGEAYPEPDIIENEDGTTTLEWYIYGVTSGQEIEPIEFGAKISRSSDHGIQYTTTFIISEHIEEGETTKIGNSEISNRTSTEAINIINLASFRLYKEAITPIIEKEGEIQYKITGINTTDVRLPDFVLLDIMPYNGDSRGTNFEGTYTIDRIEITQNIEGETRDNSNLKLYYTQDEEVKTATAKDENIGTSGIWTEVTESNNETTGNSSGLEGNETGETNAINTKCYKLNVEQSNNGVTGIAIKGELAGQTEITVDIYLKTNGNQVEDKYVNSATAQTQTITEVVQTSQESAQVIGRTISGKVWLDENYNNIIDNNEALGDLNREEIWISLYKENQEGNLEEVTNVDGQVVEAINPNEDGYYEFSHLPAENYVVKIEYNGEEYKLVEKEVGSNVEINSKFEIETNTSTEGNEGEADSNSNTEIGKTELITKLNDNSNFMIIEENVNAGLLKKINLEFTKVAEENHENTIGGTEFKLYKLVCTEHDEGYHDNEQIDTSNENSCWELVDTQTSSTGGILNNEESGKVKFKDLQVNEEYRLVETKASLNRIKPDGQWKIEFTKLENENTDNSDIIINGNIKVQITAIGNPPGFIQNQENGELLLPNRAYFEFPTSGSIGSKTIYQIGIAIITTGMIILLTRKFFIIKK